MKCEIRIPGSVYEAALSDLKRPHPFAEERVGFFEVSLGRVSESRILLCLSGYSSIPDEDYLDDPGAGARIGSKAIRDALQRILASGIGQLHVHLHDHCGTPRPSKMDSREMPPLLKSMVVTGPSCAHGAMILSHDSAWAQVLLPGQEVPIIPASITVIGFPIQFLAR